MHNEVTERSSDSRVLCTANASSRSLCSALGATVIDGRRYYVISGSDYRPGWVDPLAVVLAVAGVGCGALLLTQSRTTSADRA